MGQQFQLLVTKYEKALVDGRKEDKANKDRHKESHQIEPKLHRSLRRKNGKSQESSILNKKKPKAQKENRDAYHLRYFILKFKILVDDAIQQEAQSTLNNLIYEANLKS
jgi:hypothetical protein